MAELFHYTDTATLDQITVSGVVRAAPAMICRWLIPFPGRTKTIEPVVWLTTNPTSDPQAVAKVAMKNHGRLVFPRVARITVSRSLDGVMPIEDYCESRKIPLEWFRGIIHTENSKAMRVPLRDLWLHPGDIPRADWLRTETCCGQNNAGTKWRLHWINPTSIWETSEDDAKANRS